MAKLLHEPTVAVKEAAGTPRGERLVEALRALFDLVGVTGRPRLRMATRGSPLARWQAARVAGLLADAGAGRRNWWWSRPPVTPSRTCRSTPSAGRASSSRRCRRPWLAGRADLAVHSAKDLPASSPAGASCWLSVPERADPRDAVVGRLEAGLDVCRRGRRWPPGPSGGGPSWPAPAGPPLHRAAGQYRHPAGGGRPRRRRRRGRGPGGRSTGSAGGRRTAWPP